MFPPEEALCRRNSISEDRHQKGNIRKETHQKEADWKETSNFRKKLSWKNWIFHVFSSFVSTSKGHPLYGVNKYQLRKKLIQGISFKTLRNKRFVRHIQKCLTLRNVLVRQKKRKKKSIKLHAKIWSKEKEITIGVMSITLWTIVAM